MKSSPAKSPVKRTPSAAAEDDSTTVYDVIEVPDLDLSMEEWYMLDHKLKPGQVIRISVTVRNLGQRAVNERLSIRVERDAFFQANNVPLPVSSIPAYGEAKVNITLKVQAVRNLDKLPPSKELMLVKDAGPGKLHKVSSISIVIPIDPFIRHLKEEFKAIKVQLWGLFGTGKSSFINSIATLFNEDPRFPDQKLSPAYSAPSGGTVTLKIKPYKFNNVTLVDTWGWEEQRKELYSDLLFQLMLGGCLGSDFDMDKGKSINVLELPKLKQGGGEPVDLLLFFITVEAVDNDAYVEQMNRFIGEARKLKKPFLVLLTQIDRIDPSLRDEPYCNSPTVRSLATKVALKAGLNEGLVQPVVNYTFESERTWAMDRAAFVTLYKAFLTCETTDW